MKSIMPNINETDKEVMEKIIVAAWDPNTIILYDPTTKAKATTISNGVYLKENSRHNVYTHDGASGHAWLWVQGKNGTWYWIDPTWTDNTGYVWWGIVEGGKEVQYYPGASYCVSSNYPKPGITGSGTRSSDSTYTGDTNSFGLSYLGYGIGYVSSFDFSTVGFNFSIENQFTKNFIPYSLTFDLYFDKNIIADNKELSDSNYTGDIAFIIGTAIGYQITQKLLVYAGAGIGLYGTYSLGGESSSSQNDAYYGGGSSGSQVEHEKKTGLAFKVDAGLRLQFSTFFGRFDVSYGSIIGPSFGIGIGMFL